jgi:hypothetical protein
MSSAGGSFLQRSSSMLQRSGSALQQANSNFYALNEQLSTRWSMSIKLVNQLPHNLGDMLTSAAGSGHTAAAAGGGGAGTGQLDAAGLAARVVARKHAAKKAALLLLAVRHLACLVQVGQLLLLLLPTCMVRLHMLLHPPSLLSYHLLNTLLLLLQGC